MVWLWRSNEEFLDQVSPILVKHSAVRRTQLNTWFENQRELHLAASELRCALQQLRELGFSQDSEPPTNRRILPEAHRIVRDIVWYGESLTLLHRRGVVAGAYYGFLHQHSILEEWERYSGDGRIFAEINQLITDTDELLTHYHEFIEEDGAFLVDDLEIPTGLQQDFRLARNLFSVGFDDVGLLIAGRGLEGVLRGIAEVRKLKLVVKATVTQASEADFNDLIEVFYRVRWKKSGVRLITAETKALLNYLRVLRNAGAHPAHHGSGATVGPREKAVLVAATANQLWKEIAGSRAHLEPLDVHKTW
jgi:hypothetical protein